MMLYLAEKSQYWNKRTACFTTYSTKDFGTYGETVQMYSTNSNT
jgi:hypothetical protein